MVHYPQYPWLLPNICITPCTAAVALNLRQEVQELVAAPAAVESQCILREHPLVHLQDVLLIIHVYLHYAVVHFVLNLHGTLEEFIEITAFRSIVLVN